MFFVRLVANKDGTWTCRTGRTDIDARVMTFREAMARALQVAADMGPSLLVVHHQDGSVEHLGPAELYAAAPEAADLTQ
ncbi:MAG TPA: hypothetical protein VG650_07250 [Mycobacteriales bacterium]|nr:hypothetical protein [Mycobacteriales bacterium]HWC34609.1 hypothetical protein [Mycobacteriales bacterium]